MPSLTHDPLDWKGEPLTRHVPGAPRQVGDRVRVIKICDEHGDDPSVVYQAAKAFVNEQLGVKDLPPIEETDLF